MNADTDLYDEPMTDQDPREGKDEVGSAKGEEGEGQTATIPKSLVPGDVNVGEEIVLKVEKVFNEELLVSYSPNKPTEEKSSPEMPSSPSDSMYD